MRGIRNTRRSVLVAFAVGLLLPVSAVTACRMHTAFPCGTEPARAVFVPDPPTTPSVSPPWSRGSADLYVVHDDDMEGLAVARLRPGRAATDDALVSHTPLPRSIYDVARLGDHVLAMTATGLVHLLDPASGLTERTVRITPRMLGERTFTSLVVDETESYGDRAYVAGRFGRPGQRAFAGFVLGFDPALTVVSVRTFDDVVQNVAADAQGAVAVLTDGRVVDAVTGATLRAPTYERASEAMAVRRTGRDLWIAVGEGDGPFVLTPHGRVVLPAARDALPIAVVAVPGGVVVVSQSVDAVHIVTATGLRTVRVPQSGADAVLLGNVLYVLSAGSNRLTRIDLPGLTSEEYVMPDVSSLLI